MFHSKSLNHFKIEKMIKIRVFVATSILFFCFMGCKTMHHPKGEWVSLLKGNNLKNWTVKIKNHAVGENYKNTFRAKNGVLSINYDQYENFEKSFGHIFYYKEFSNYKLRLEYRFVGEQVKGGEAWALRNSGIMVHCENPYNMGLSQNFPVSIEVQLLGGNGVDERPTANVCTPGTHITLAGKKEETHCIKSTSKTFHGNQWVKVEVEVRNSEYISHTINGVKVMEYSKPVIGGDTDANTEFWKTKEGSFLEKGFISLQSESHPVEFRRIEILEM